MAKRSPVVVPGHQAPPSWPAFAAQQEPAAGTAYCGGSEGPQFFYVNLPVQGGQPHWPAQCAAPDQAQDAGSAFHWGTGVPMLQLPPVRDGFPLQYGMWAALVPFHGFEQPGQFLSATMPHESLLAAPNEEGPRVDRRSAQTRGAPRSLDASLGETGERPPRRDGDLAPADPRAPDAPARVDSSGRVPLPAAVFVDLSVLKEVPRDDGARHDC